MNISLFGTGLMGYPMAERLLAAGHPLTVYNRTAAKAKALETKGAKIVRTPQEAVEASACLILVLTDAAAIQDVLFAEGSVSLSGKTVIQMGTIAPAESVAFAKKVTAQKGEYLECPVLGSRGEAAGGRLVLMVGGSQAQFERWQELLRVFGPQPRHAGEVGKAAALKLALNQLIAAHAAAFSLSLGLVQKSGVDIDVFVHILKESPLFAPMFEKKLPHWLNGDYANPNFPVKHLLKDVTLILQEARSLGLYGEVVASIQGALRQARDKGWGDEDYSAVFKAINNV